MLKNELAMRDQSINRLLWQFSLPAIAGMLVSALYNIVDRIFVGRGVGAIAIAATTVAFPIMMTLGAISVLISIGATAQISIRLGERRTEEAEKIVGNATAMLVLVPIVITLFYFAFADSILLLFGADQAVLPYARDFTGIIMLGSLFGTIGFGLTNFIRAEGNPRFSMYTQVIGAVVNGILNYVFIFKLGMGIKGSAWASVVGQLLSAVMALGYFFTGRSSVKIRLKNLRPELPVFLGIATTGFPPFAMQLVGSLQQVILNRTLISYGGDMALSAVGIMMSIAILLFMPVVGISQGAQPIIGYNYGARQYGRVRETLKKAIIAGTAIALAGYVVLRVWPAELVGLFTRDNPDLVQFTSRAMVTFFTLIPIMAFQVLCSGYFQAVGKPVQATLLGLSRQVLLFIPLLLILPRIWGINGVWRTAPIADFLSTVTTAVFIYYEMKTLRITSSALPKRH